MCNNVTQIYDKEQGHMAAILTVLFGCESQASGNMAEGQLTVEMEYLQDVHCMAIGQVKTRQHKDSFCCGNKITVGYRRKLITTFVERAV